MKPETMLEERAMQRAVWLRSAIIIANGGIMGLAGVVAAVSAAAASETEVLIAGVAGLVAGAIALAAVEYGTGTARAEGRLPALGVAPEPFAEAMDAGEVAAMYRSRGLSAALAEEAAQAALHPAPARGAPLEPRPWEAALTSATAFAVGAAVPVTFASLFPLEAMAAGVGICATLVAAVLAGLGVRGTQVPAARVMVRVAMWSAAAIGASYLAGSVVGAALN